MFKRWLMYKYYNIIQSWIGRFFLIIVLTFAIGLVGSKLFIILGIGTIPHGGTVILLASIWASIKITKLPKSYDKDDYYDFWE